ncbi:MAG: non-heme iron oxygenase ferredoxin subunit [Actinomycetia bacterium]|nr:non-heme iron oxygenase ferredoxin subunit [Actinomycetes bacterium]
MRELNAGPLTDLPAESGVRIVDGDTAVALFRVGDGVHAIADRCSHAEASLSEGEVFGDEVECPRHGAEFDLTTGKALTLPATKPVAVYATDVRDGNVFIEISDGESSDE